MERHETLFVIELESGVGSPNKFYTFPLNVMATTATKVPRSCLLLFDREDRYY